MITREMKIGEILRQHPETLTVFEKYRLDCYECQIADIEDLKHGAEVHRIDVEALLSELNRVAQRR